MSARIAVAEIDEDAEQLDYLDAVLVGQMVIGRRHVASSLGGTHTPTTSAVPAGQGVLGVGNRGRTGLARCVHDDRLEVALGEAPGHGRDAERPVDDVGAVQGGQSDRFGHLASRCVWRPTAAASTR